MGRLGDGGSFLIEIHSATEKLKNPPKVSFSLAEISKHCQMVRTPTELDKHLHLKAGEAFFFPGGKVRLSVTKLPIEQHDTGKLLEKIDCTPNILLSLTDLVSLQ